VREIKTGELKKLIESGEVVLLIDALPQKSYAKRHIPTAINIPLKEFNLKQRLLPAKKDKKIVTYCGNASCSTSEKVAQKLENLGYTNVFRYREGMKGWKDADNRIEPQSK